MVFRLKQTGSVCRIIVWPPRAIISENEYPIYIPALKKYPSLKTNPFVTQFVLNFFRNSCLQANFDILLN